MRGPHRLLPLPISLRERRQRHDQAQVSSLAAAACSDAMVGCGCCTPPSGYETTAASIRLRSPRSSESSLSVDDALVPVVYPRSGSHHSPGCQDQSYLSCSWPRLRVRPRMASTRSTHSSHCIQVSWSYRLVRPPVCSSEPLRILVSITPFVRFSVILVRTLSVCYCAKRRPKWVAHRIHNHPVYHHHGTCPPWKSKCWPDFSGVSDATTFRTPSTPTDTGSGA